MGTVERSLVYERVAGVEPKKESQFWKNGKAIIMVKFVFKVYFFSILHWSVLIYMIYLI